MLSNFLTEDLFKKGLAVSALGQPLVVWGRGGELPLAPAPCPRALAYHRGTEVEW